MSAREGGGAETPDLFDALGEYQTALIAYGNAEHESAVATTDAEGARTLRARDDAERALNVALTTVVQAARREGATHRAAPAVSEAMVREALSNAQMCIELGINEVEPLRGRKPLDWRQVREIDWRRCLSFLEDALRHLAAALARPADARDIGSASIGTTGVSGTVSQHPSEPPGVPAAAANDEAEWHGDSVSLLRFLALVLRDKHHDRLARWADHGAGRLAAAEQRARELADYVARTDAAVERFIGAVQSCARPAGLGDRPSE